MCRNLIYLMFLSLLICLLQTIAVYAADPNLVGFWNLNESSGNVANDSSDNGNDGTLQGGPDWVAGRIGNALEFDGTGDQVDCGNDSSMDITGPITIAAWVYPTGPGDSDFPRIVDKSNGTGGADPGYKLYLRSAENYLFTLSGGGVYINSTISADLNAWNYVVFITDGTQRKLFLNGDWEVWDESSLPVSSSNPLLIGNSPAGARHFEGILDEVRVYNRALAEEEIQGIMLGEKWPYASNPKPEDGTLYEDTWVTLSWSPGELAVSHDVYLGENFNDVNEASTNSDLYRGNQMTEFYIAGFPGYAYPDGLVPGITYYWRVDEVNDADPNSPWKGNVWSISIPPKTAYNPSPADEAEFIKTNAKLNWTTGFGAKIHTIYFGDDFETVANATNGNPIGSTTYDPGPLQLAKTYYWRVDEYDGIETYPGEVWSFTTVGAVSGPNPANGAVDISPAQILMWDAGDLAASHEVYFGTGADAVASATKSSPEYKGSKALGQESYDPGKLTLSTTYYWRIDEVNDASGDSPWVGNVWSFTTGDFFVIDDFEGYNSAENQIWYAWHDGLGYGAPGTADYFAGNGTGAAVGDENTASYTEETIIHGGSKSMPLSYDNNKQGYSKYSETELTLTAVQDWTEEGVTELSIWFHGNPESVGSFAEAPAGTYTMTGSGADIWAVNGVEADEFHFAYKMLNGAGSIIAKVESITNTNVWAKAGVMIRESLNPDSAHAFACATPGNGVASQYRPSTGGTSGNFNQTGLAVPYWVKLERSISGLFTVSHSADGTSWQPVTGATAQNIAMGSNVYIGLALTSHDAALTCQAVFSNVTTTGNVTGQWTDQDIGIESNDPEPLYVAVSNSIGNSAVVIHDDANAAQIDTWTEWVILLSAFADQGINLTNVDRIAVGLGNRGNMTIPGGSGKMYFDDIRLYRQ